MRIGIVPERDSIVGWLYPGAFPEIPDPPAAFLTCPSFDDAAFTALWAATGKYDGKSEAVCYESSGCDVGVPHDAPDFVPMFAPQMVEDLAAIPDHERWRVAQQWALAHLGQRPNEQKSSLYKKVLRELCDLARSVSSTEQRLLLLRDD